MLRWHFSERRRSGDWRCQQIGSARQQRIDCASLTTPVAETKGLLNDNRCD